jgi:hypothetical protein
MARRGERGSGVMDSALSMSSLAVFMSRSPETSAWRVTLTFSAKLSPGLDLGPTAMPREGLRVPDTVSAAMSSPTRTMRRQDVMP